MKFLSMQPAERQQFELAIQKLISDRLVLGYESIVEIFDDDYRQRAPTQVLASHLVVDTDMNYLGVPLESARSYMRAHTFESHVQSESETLAYSTHIYAYTLSYWLGHEKFWELRHRAEHALGRRFDIRKFHMAALGGGSMTLDVLEGHSASPESCTIPPAALRKQLPPLSAKSRRCEEHVLRPEADIVRATTPLTSVGR